MKILALEFSSRRRSVAVADGANLLAKVETNEVSQSPLMLVDQALGEADIDQTHVETIALGIGPGSYTGIRSAIATAQGWQFANDINLYTTSSAEILASTARTNGIRGKVHFIIDAQRHEYYQTTWKLTDDSQTESAPLQIIGVSEAATLEAHGPDATGFPFCTPLYPDAAALARMAASQTRFPPCKPIEPIYIRSIDFTKAPPPRAL
ncbi:MAG: tRNA (adenosine(37)-N6)-threonylcarbamoyltransferase complex dimerization subunit type 1 TsaB [Verrucomicrobiales bacterium]|nr:tRNA (adenosine(37)-N6)-threonylcarbamoyltransferase complex dimerization subunit type 1 TsaB [Verrucomicrobiales bacterium]|tara:strand:- start:4496 stop:5119 length:624 start_codon:yes stop_codon:yes gene_type:complete